MKTKHFNQYILYSHLTKTIFVKISLQPFRHSVFTTFGRNALKKTNHIKITSVFLCNLQVSQFSKRPRPCAQHRFTNICTDLYLTYLNITLRVFR